MRWLSRIGGLSPGQWIAMLQAQWLMPAVKRRLKRDGLKATMAWCAQGRADHGNPPDVGLVRARRLAVAVNASCRYGLLRGACLERSLILSRLLSARGLAHEVVIGGDWQAHGLQAHAWVEMAGEVVNDAPDVRSRFGIFEPGP